ncbi:Hypothetical protein NAEGRDRAFT_59334 [Naegleria gruberi]|uniref:Uncharacterized protein n=1 Tax=Naegleria gruberi TaxID=5762 RepID=D2VVG6_NAEGR|nr:uncharacterized protein NAEGRDRAFT_59334 [Naegleria gruberi]EFC39233.1 Hypothetical protein NAEGRDRAFT_59334 [Naegleria gruberi]|eukprot:XP_002671977.1 Hypothetical protein NAEGRDRAFT_59334 [Naegleria gruberi strain NEG-M]
MLGYTPQYLAPSTYDGGNSSKKRKYPDKPWHHKLKPNTRVELVNYIVEVTQGNAQVIRKKIFDLIIQSQAVDDFARDLAEYACSSKSNLSMDTIRDRVEVMLERDVNALPTPNLAHRLNQTVRPLFNDSNDIGMSVRANQFNNELFEKLVERNKLFTHSSVNNTDVDIPELMEQYKYCNKLAKLWIMQDLTRRREELSKSKLNAMPNELHDDQLLHNLPFDLMFEIVSYIPVDNKSIWWAQFLKYRIISNSFKLRLEQEIFTKFSKEGIDISHFDDSLLTLEGLTCLLASHSQYEKQGKQFNGDFIRLHITEKQTELQKLTAPKFNGNIIPPNEESNSNIVETQIFDEEYVAEVYSQSANQEITPQSPFQRNFIANKESFDNTPLPFINEQFNSFECEEFENPYIKSITISSSRDFHFIIPGLVNLEELTLIVSTEDFMYLFSKMFQTISHLKLKKIVLVYYGVVPASFTRLILDKVEMLDYGGSFYVYSAMDTTFISNLRISLPNVNIICEGRVLNRSNDFRDLKVIPCRIQNFTNTKFILDNGWYRPVVQRTRSYAQGDEKFATIFNNDWFTVKEKKELLNYFVDRYSFNWKEELKTSIHQSLFQYYIYLLNINQKQFEYNSPTKYVNEPKNKPNLLDCIVWGLDVSNCPEQILRLCTNFGKIGLKLVIDKLEKDPDYLTIEHMRIFFKQAAHNSDYLHLLVQLIPHINNSEHLFDVYQKNGDKVNILLSVIPNNPILVEHIIDNFVTSANLQSELQHEKSPKSLLQTTIQSQLPNSTILKIAQKNPKLLYQKSKNGRIPLHYCFTPHRYQLIKPFLEMAPETFEYEDENGFKPYHFVQEHELSGYGRIYDILWMAFKPRTKDNCPVEHSLDVLHVKQEGSLLMVSYFSEAKPLAAAILTSTSFESYSDRHEFKFKAEDCCNDQIGGMSNLLVQFCKEYLRSSYQTNLTFQELCRKYVHKRDAFGFSLLHHFIFNGFTAEIIYLESIMGSSIFPMFLEIEQKKLVNSSKEVLYSTSKNYFLKEKCREMLTEYCQVLKGKAGFEDFVALELERLSEIRLLGVATGNTEFKTRLLYLYNFLTISGKLISTKNPTLGLASNQKIRERIFNVDQNKYIGTKNVEEITRFEIIIGCFLLFNYGHLGDERVVERNILYNLWRSCIELDAKRTPREEIKTSKDATCNPTEEPRTSKHSKQPSDQMEFSHSKPLVETPKKKQKKTSESPNTTPKLTPPPLLISTPNISSVSTNILEPTTPTLKDYIHLKQQMNLSDKCITFLKHFPEKCRERAEDYIRSSDWNHFHRALAIWRLVNKMTGALKFEFDFKTIEGTLLFIGEYFFECLSKSTNSLLKSFFIVRQLAYLLSDNPENSLFILNAEKLSDIFKDENIISKLYTRSDLRGRTLQFENEYYLNTSLMNEKYASKMLFHLKSNKKVCELSEELFNKKTSETHETKEKYFATVVYPVINGGDFALYRQLNYQFREEYEFLVQKWVGGQYPDFSLVFFFLKKSFSLQHLFKILGNSCAMWKNNHSSCFSKILELSRSYNIITNNLKNIGNLILKEFFGGSYVFEIDCSNNLEIMWTLAYGNAESVENLTQYSQLFGQKDEIFESLSLCQSYFYDVVSTGYSPENDESVFMFLWGNLLVKQKKSHEVQQFDVCWVKMDKLKVSLYLGEAKNNTSENAQNVFDGKVDELRLPCPRYQMQEKNLTVGVWEKSYRDLKIYKITNFTVEKETGESVNTLSVFFVSDSKKDTLDFVTNTFKLTLEEKELDVDSPILEKKDLSLCDISTVNSVRFKNGNGKFIIASSLLKSPRTTKEDGIPDRVVVKEDGRLLFVMDLNYQKEKK